MAICSWMPNSACVAARRACKECSALTAKHGSSCGVWRATWASRHKRIVTYSATVFALCYTVSCSGLHGVALLLHSYRGFWLFGGNAREKILDDIAASHSKMCSNMLKWSQMKGETTIFASTIEFLPQAPYFRKARAVVNVAVIWQLQYFNSLKKCSVVNVMAAAFAGRQCAEVGACAEFRLSRLAG